LADSPSNDLEIINPDAGLGFRAEMFMNNFIMGYWKGILGTLVTLLALILIFGNYQNWYTGKQYATSDEIANVLKQFSAAHPEMMPPGALIDQYTRYLTPPLALSDDPELLRHTQIAAQKLRDIGGTGSGAAAAQAYLLSSEFFRIAGDEPARSESLDLMNTATAGASEAATALSLAGALRASGDLDGGLAALQGVSVNHKDTLIAQWAALERARLLGDAGRHNEAATVLDELILQYPDGKLKETAEGELERLGRGVPSDIEGLAEEDPK
jgi:hypothetical protein